METQDQLPLQSQMQRKEMMFFTVKCPLNVIHVGEILSGRLTLMLTLQSTQAKSHFLATAVGKVSELESH